MKDETPLLGPGDPAGALALRIARAAVTDTTGEHTPEEKVRLQDALDRRPDELSRALSELFANKGGGR
jgi:hypothetical protein